MFGLIMTLIAKVAVEMFAKGAGTAITLLCTGTKLRKRKWLKYSYYIIITRCIMI